MQRRFVFPILAAILIFFTAFSFPTPSRAEVMKVPKFESSAFDLINAVNALRASNGLSAYSINSILMYTAQSQADFMAATGNVTHTGAGGSSVTSRLLAAGYPLAGDLSLGGFRSENIISGSEGMTAQEAVNAWTGDAPHLTTMLSTNLSEIGAGVTVTGGRVYYVIDAAHSTTGGGGSSAVTPVIVNGTVVPAIGGVIIPVSISTPNADGDVIHEVLAGQSLWQIAIEYGVKIDDIKRLNNLFDNDIYPGEKLLVKKDVVAVTDTPTATATLEAIVSPTQTALPTATMTMMVMYTSTSTPLSASMPAANNKTTIMGVALGILALALLGGAIVARLGNSKKS